MHDRRLTASQLDQSSTSAALCREPLMAAAKGSPERQLKAAAWAPQFRPETCYLRATDRTRRAVAS